MANNESALQAQCVKWFKETYKDFEFNIHSIPNGAHLAGDKKRRGMKMNKMKAEGLLSGVFDIHITIPSLGKCGMFIEMKYGRNKPSPEQIKFMEVHKEHYVCVICYTLNDFMAAVNSYLIPLLLHIKTATK